MFTELVIAPICKNTGGISVLSLASWLEKKALLKSVACDANGFPNNGTVRNGNCWGGQDSQE